MAIQIIFCVETNQKADTDSVYIMETIRHLYALNNQIKISKIYMGTKTKYKSNSVLKKILQKEKAFVIGDTKVVYCIDTDDYDKSNERKEELQDIKKFCKEKDFELIWFCHDIEEVYYGKKISDSQKIKAANAFRKKKMIQEIELKKLSGQKLHVHTSNILTVLDQFIPRKQSGEKEV